MWWLERSDLLKRGQWNAHQLGSYPRTANLWLKDRLHDKEVKRSFRKPLDFTLRPILRPDIEPLRPDLRLPIEQIKPFEEDEEIERFKPPSSWRYRLKEPFPGDSKKYRLEKEEVIVVEEKELTPAEKEKILLEQEGFVAKKRPRWRDVISSLESKERTDDQGKSPLWINKALVTKPPGRAEGLRAPVSAIGSKLNKISTNLKLWHEQLSNRDGRAATGILLRQAYDDLEPTAAELELCKPVCNFLRVPVLQDYKVPPRVSPEEQEMKLEKGGHGSFRQEVTDQTVMLDSIRRRDDPSERHLEAAAVLYLGVLYDNGQDYTKAVENYEKFIEICREKGDVKGEAMGCNFVACSLQEDQDKKIKNKTEKVESVGSMGELKLSTEATIQFEKALEYHERHARIADLEGKYVAYTNAGLLQLALGRWTDSARSHRKALQCATYMRRPDQQSVAVGNLACLLLRRKKYGAARLCTKRYLQICEGLRYTHGMARAHYMLGHIFFHQNKLIEAAEEFRISMNLAKKLNMRDLELSAKVLIGVVKGQMELGRAKTHCLGSRVLPSY